MAAVVGAALAVCSWASPGADPYMGDVLAAVDRYRDIPATVRQALQARMLAHQYDDIAEIRRDTIQGVQSYSDLRDMHFGEGRLCRLPSRALWSAQHTELGLVYCEAEHCLIVPTVCRNVSRVTRLIPPPPRLDDIPGGSDLATGWTFDADSGSDESWLSRADIEPIRLPVSDPPAPVARSFAEPIPEPSTFAGFALSLVVLGLFLMHRRRMTVYDVVLVMLPKRRNVV